MGWFGAVTRQVWCTHYAWLYMSYLVQPQRRDLIDIQMSPKSSEWDRHLLKIPEPRTWECEGDRELEPPLWPNVVDGSISPSRLSQAMFCRAGERCQESNPTDGMHGYMVRDEWSMVTGS